MRTLAYGTHADTQYDYLRICESTTFEAIYRFCKATIGVFGPHYLRGPNEIEATCIMAQNAHMIFL
jgi:hypothetical protein